jgi:two-component system, NarL family, nitrate/nitrite response regulator NarL
MVNILLADDHTAFAEALAHVLDDVDRHVVGVTCLLDDVIAAVRATSPDLCLLDRWFDDDDALDLLSDLRAARAEMKIVLLTADPDRDVPRRAFDRGADGFVHKTRGISALLDALDRVLDGETVVELPPRWTAPRRADPSADSHGPRLLATYLTAREKQCLALLVDGVSTAEMATRLGISITTVRTHVQAVITKLSVHTRLEAVAYAVRYGLTATRNTGTRRA